MEFEVMLFNDIKDVANVLHVLNQAVNQRANKDQSKGKLVSVMRKILSRPIESVYKCFYAVRLHNLVYASWSLNAIELFLECLKQRTYGTYTEKVFRVAAAVPKLLPKYGFEYAFVLINYMKAQSTDDFKRLDYKLINERATLIMRAKKNGKYTDAVINVLN